MPTSTHGRVRATANSLNQWVEAHRTLMDEESTLVELARRVGSQECPVDALEQQQVRVAALEKQVEALYDQVMAELANSRTREPGTAQRTGVANVAINAGSSSFRRA
jgi:small-conductance mechanosensitive channel